MEQLNLPPFLFKLRSIDGQKQIYDAFRRKWLKCTPEEWVRQHVAVYLTQLGYPAKLLSLEHLLKLNTMSRRADILAYRPDGSPFLLVECKAPHIKVNQETLNQAARYNLTMKVPYLLITNGLNHYCLEVLPSGDSRYLSEIPEFPSQRAQQ